MAFPAEEAKIAAAEQALGRKLPTGLRERLLRDNGGDITVDGYPGDAEWQLCPVWDDGDRKRMARTADHILRETEEHGGDVPGGAVVIGTNGTGDLLVLAEDGDDPAWWDHETGELHPVTTDWS